MHLNKNWLVVVLLGLVATACAGEPTSTPTTEPEREVSEQVEAAPTEASAPTEEVALFAEASKCAACHTNMQDESGADVSFDAAWRATMMANSARDPYWQATVRSEVLKNPDLQTVIEDKCAQCHMPMANVTTRAAGGEGQVLDDGFLDPDHDVHALAVDGVSCTLCHQVQATNFGEQESFEGGFVIDLETPAGERSLFGPFAVGPANVTLMQNVSGFVPVQSEHIQQSEMCATCHTLYTPYVDAAGQVVGVFPEQMPYLEWLNSDYADSTSCQGCHMPLAEGGIVLSATGGEPRSPVAQHAFVGGNVFMSEMLSTFSQEQDVVATAEEFDAAAPRAQDLMQNRTATLALEDMSVSADTLTADVVVRSQVGHKFPAAFPSRRAWLHLTVMDASGQVVFESGAFEPDGSIIGNDNDADPAAYEPHYVTVTGPEEVQIYEAIMRDSDGEVTTTLLRAAEYSKDNRLLPVGFDVQAASADIAVYGQALEDEDFLAGGDVVGYEIGLSGVGGPYTVTAELLYQSIGYRWAQNLREPESREALNFLSYYDAVPNQPVVVASDTVEVAP